MDSASPAASWFRPNRFTRALAVLVVVGACWAAYWIGANTYDPIIANDGLTIAPKDLNFGTVLEQEAFVWKVALSNPTRRAIGIDYFETSCGCVAIEPKSLTLEPGESRAIELTIDLTRRPAEERAASRHGYALKLIPIVKHGLAHLGWVLRGEVQTVFSAEPSAVDFGDEHVIGTVPPRRSVRLTGYRQVHIHSVAADPPLLDARVLAPAKGRSFTIDLTPKIDLVSGPFACELRVEATAEDGEALPAFSIPVRGVARYSVEAAPQIVQLGAREVGSVVEDTVTLRSLLDEPFEVVRTVAKETAADLTMRDGAVICRIRQPISASGWHEAALSFRIKTKQQEFSVGVTVNYYGRTKALEKSDEPD
jgi:hypothetical protein